MSVAELLLTAAVISLLYLAATFWASCIVGKRADARAKRLDRMRRYAAEGHGGHIAHDRDDTHA